MKHIHKTISYFIVTVWILNGLFCKVLNFVPRHEQIVARILGDTYSRATTILIGFSELGIAFWIILGIKPRLNALFQIVIIATMNILEFILVPDLLLWGKLNSIFAALFIILIYFNYFHFNRLVASRK